MDHIESLFPTPLMRCKTLVDAELLKALSDQIRRAHMKQNAKSTRLSHTDIVDPAGDELYQRLIRLAVPKLVDFGAALFGERLRWIVKELWTNVLETGGRQSLHSHANSFVSGVVYLTPSHPSAATMFVRGGGGAEFVFRHDTPSTEIGPYNAGKWVTPDVEAGDMILFPSYMLHEVPRNQGGQRITLAFNAIPERLDSWGYAIRFAR